MAAQRLPPGAEVVSQGAASDALFFLRSGAARAVRRRAQGRSALHVFMGAMTRQRQASTGMQLKTKTNAAGAQG